MKGAAQLKHHLLWGAALGVSEALTIQVLTWMGLGLSHATWILVYLLVMVFAVLAGRSFQKRLGHRPGFGQTLAMLAVVILLSRLIYQTYMFVYINYVDPTWVDTVAQVWSSQLAESGTAPEQVAQQIAQFRAEWETTNVFTLGLISYGIAQFVLALLAVVLVVLQPWQRNRAATD